MAHTERSKSHPPFAVNEPSAQRSTRAQHSHSQVDARRRAVVQRSRRAATRSRFDRELPPCLRSVNAQQLQEPSRRGSRLPAPMLAHGSKVNAAELAQNLQRGFSRSASSVDLRRSSRQHARNATKLRHERHGPSTSGRDCNFSITVRRISSSRSIVDPLFGTAARHVDGSLCK